MADNNRVGTWKIALGRSCVKVWWMRNFLMMGLDLYLNYIVSNPFEQECGVTTDRCT